MTKIFRFAFNVVQWKPTQQQWNKSIALLQACERRRADSFVFANDSKRAVVCRLLIRYTISRCLGLDNASIHLERSARGRPFLTNQKQKSAADFNASHDGDWVVIALTHEGNIGIDVVDAERTISTEHNRFFKLMESKFSREEWKYIKSPSDEKDQMFLFYRFWCLKESYVKATGDGISYPLINLSFQVTEPLQIGQATYSTTLEIQGQPASNWLFEERLLDDRHIICLAHLSPVRGTSATVTCLSIDDVLSQLNVDSFDFLECNKFWTSFQSKPYKGG